MRTPIIIDTDPGIDDAIALALAAASDEVDVRAIIAVAGNVGLEHTAPNAAGLADLLGLACPVGRGASGPLWRRDTKPARAVHGEDGLGGYPLAASSRLVQPGLELMAQAIEDSPTPPVLVAIGPLTNVAGLLTHYPEQAAQLERIVFMGGGTGEHLGNVTAAAEFNLYSDPDAGARVLAGGVPITMVGLNVTERALVSWEDFGELRRSGGPVCHLVEHLLGNYGSEARAGGKAQHDSLALAAAIWPEQFRVESRFVDVENTGRLTSGMTVVDWAGASGQAPNCEVVVDFSPTWFRQLLTERLAHLDRILR
ncbi:nucleoside hydrolase [Actinomyces sp. F1_1611]